jgi:DNA invertase Pin-like site-specific DNA recombinase
MIYAYGYCRFSSTNQDEKSIAQQKMELEEFAKRNNVTIIDYYCDEAKTGTADNRDYFQNMISDCIKLKKVQAVLVWKTDRFARNAQDNLFYRSKLNKVGVKLISITQLGANDDTPEGKLMSTMLARNG